MKVIGWIGGLLLAWCGAPQAIRSIKQGHSKGISRSFLFMWGVGEIFVLAYVLPNGDLPLIFNYFANIIFVGIILKYKFWERK